MNRFINGLYVFILLLLPYSALAEHSEVPKHMIGTLECKVLPHSGLNLLIHSSRDIRCTFTSQDQRMVEYYKGETGISFGVDIGLGKSNHIDYSVLARDAGQSQYRLAGKYSGAAGKAMLGVSVGDAAPIEKDDKSISLQPIHSVNEGMGASAGFSYLYLEADN